jgi:hypothetical protein
MIEVLLDYLRTALESSGFRAFEEYDEARGNLINAD